MTKIPFVSLSGLIVISAGLNGRRREFVVDTGASHTVLTARAARELGVSPTDGSAGPAIGLGGSVRATTVRIQEFTLGDEVFSNTTMLVVPMDTVCGLGSRPDIAGIIGMDLLSMYRFTVDSQIQDLTLERSD